METQKLKFSSGCGGFFLLLLLLQLHFLMFGFSLALSLCLTSIQEVDCLTVVL